MWEYRHNDTDKAVQPERQGRTAGRHREQDVLGIATVHTWQAAQGSVVGSTCKAV